MNLFSNMEKCCIFAVRIGHKSFSMNNVVTIPAVSRTEMNDFINLPRRIYAGNKQYVPDLDIDVRAMFDPRKNASLKVAQMQAFVAYRNGIPVGRIAGIVNSRANEKWHTRIVRFGMIEFIDDIEVSTSLIHAVEAWGHKMGLNAIQGPMGITDYDKEGMLLEDFDLPSSMAEIYNPPYYPEHMQQLGFRKDADWLQIRVDVPTEIPEKYARVAEIARSRYDLKIRKFTRKELHGQAGMEMFHLLNQAYSPLFGFVDFTEEQITDFVNKYVDIIDMDLITGVTNANGELVAIAVTMGSLTHAMQKAGGRLLPTGWWHLLRSLKFHHEDTVNLLLIAVRPDMQGKGVNSLLFADLINIYNRKGYRHAETCPQLEHNIKELSQWGPFSPQYVKRRRCWIRDITTSHII